jgi:hypothetical protein
MQLSRVALQRGAWSLVGVRLRRKGLQRRGLIGSAVDLELRV